ncbi:hypothetical protein M514_17131 [Trichuris suis]|uniref:Uncharacterized protein n=1 Tax=Trichuris suis TaxID=68888 RepID=A0A085NMG3_9BILA|nr:hypothetical protein M514_17131 [Trichuris suis]
MTCDEKWCLYDNSKREALRPMYEGPKMLEEMGINLILHRAYSADLPPTDYHFFNASNYIYLPESATFSLCWLKILFLWCIATD